MLNSTYPPIPGFPQGEPGFVDWLKEPVRTYSHRDDQAAQPVDTLDLRAGLAVDLQFPDPEKLLETAVYDLNRALDDLKLKGDKIPIRLMKNTALENEDFTLAVNAGGITIHAGNTEGIRRAVYALVDKLAALDTPFMAYGKESKHFWMHTRISRCFFGPIKRPPFNVDELMNDIDYYPEEYLSRLARNGINGLWLTVIFRELSSTKLLGEDPNAARRRAKLQQVCDRCRRYGIRIWLFVIEPVSWFTGNPLPAGKDHLAGPGFDQAIASGIGERQSFCVNSDEAQEYLYEAANSIFSLVKGLGGMIILPKGERFSSCLSTLRNSSEDDIPCAKRCKYSLPEIFARLMNPISRGIRAAQPDAQLMVWIYYAEAPQLASWIYRLPTLLDKDIIYTCNFESGFTKNQMGKVRTGGDYWLSCTGPADRFGRMMDSLRNVCQLGAKLQVACSHEIATVPYIPVPGILYRKYREMKKLGVSHAMQCWFFGNFPGLMNQATGMLACEDFSTGEEEFLTRLAYPVWGKDAAKVVEAWKTFEKAYDYYPLDNQFQYYGPMHDGTMWPLHLRRVRKQLPRTWKPDVEPAGDALGEALRHFTLNEAAMQLRRMNSIWQEGWEKLKSLIGKYPASDEQTSVIRAMGIIINSADRIFAFYSMRSALFKGSGDAAELLDKMENLVKAEIAASDELAEICEKDPRLGYHSEAEVFKFDPVRLRWRSGYLREVVLKDFADCRKAMAAGSSFKDFADNPETMHCVTGKWYSNGRMRWIAEVTPEFLNVEVVCDDLPEATEEYLKFHMMDENGERFPIPSFGTARRSDEKVDCTGCSSLTKSEIDGGWKVNASFPLEIFDRDSRILFGLEMLEYVDGKERNFTFPAGNFTDELRLNLGYFTPDRTVVLELK
ncbi:MAG: hypothetical protein E7057_08430 [Lentisphaerae bacterium]|nr:hypothetical protein [Lentisphaerota bacterium]